MTVLDPFDMLVRLGKITQANVQAADLVEAGVGTSTRAARLVAVGVDKEKLLSALSELTRMPIAPREMLEAAAPMKLPASYATTMKELLAVPIGRVDEHILDIAIADPRTTTKLRDAAIAHRPRLALEPDILAALARVFPGDEVLDPIHEPTLKNVPLAPRPISVDEGAIAGDAPALSPEALAALEAASAPGALDGALEALEARDTSAPRGALDADASNAPSASALDDLAPIGVGEPSSPGEAAPRKKPLSPFALTKVQDEETQRVRRRGAHGDEPPSIAEPSGTIATSPMQRAVARAHVIVADTRARFATMNAPTRLALAGIAALTALGIIVIVATSGSDDDVAALVTDAGVMESSADAGPAEPVDAGIETAPVIEKPKAEPPQKRKKKKKGSRTTRKKPTR